MIYEPSIPAKDDGLFFGEVGSWAEDKHRLVALYDSLFSTGMKKKWGSRVYIDLYSGPGLLKIRDTNKFIWGSPILALDVKDPFDKYIFCENDAAALDALKKRVANHFPYAKVEFVLGNCNEQVDRIGQLLPKATRTHSVLSFCFVDPFDLSIQFATIKRIAEHFVDFLFLLALHMDANRNLAAYLDTKSKKIDDFLGMPNWRERWLRLQEPKSFPRFLAEMYAGQMQTLRYLPVGFDKMKQVRSDVRNLPLYHLALFSRHELAYEYWDEVLNYSTPQLRLDLRD
ncbi:MAG TPA: three-Cys-motif partner protein TcmP [Candidatus Acidoferrum sp.]|nr:three-Cys-motif partner protein TcmP [Candidatus Acidoferrum sp.]